jgi:abortive infection bacteriophage resistance protein
MKGGKIMAQNFLTYEQQIAKLRDDKGQGLIVTDEDASRKILEEIGYYSLHSAERFLGLLNRC